MSNKEFEQVVCFSLQNLDKETQKHANTYFENIKRQEGGWLFLLDFFFHGENETAKTVSLQLLEQIIRTWKQEQPEFETIYSRFFVFLKDKQNHTNTRLSNRLIPVWVLSCLSVEAQRLQSDLLELFGTLKTPFFSRLCSGIAEEYELCEETSEKKVHFKRLQNELFYIPIDTTLSFMDCTKNQEEISSGFQTICALLPFVNISVFADKLVSTILLFFDDPAIFSDAYNCLCAVLSKKTTLANKLLLVEKLGVRRLVEGYMMERNTDTREKLLHLLVLSLCSFKDFKKESKTLLSLLEFVRSFYQLVLLISNEADTSFVALLPFFSGFWTIS